MIHDVDAIYDQGVFRPTEPLALPQGARVHLRVEQEAASQTADNGPPASETPSLLERLKQVAGCIDDLPEDSSERLDHYLYGRGEQ
jgi:predicted DNA-binding antitoxin AbrB/MazE fold protein